MNLHKLFRVLVLGGAATGAGVGCASSNANQKPSGQQQPAAANHDGGTAAPPPAAPPASGGGVSGW